MCIRDSFYGDDNGDRRIDASDLFGLRGAFRRTSADPQFDDDFDFDNNGRIDAADLFQFRTRFRTVLNP